MGSIQKFILKRKQLGHITTARFDVEMTLQGWGEKDLLEDDAIEFSLASIDLPTVRANYEQVYFDTMPVETFKNFTYDPDFSMTVICDNEGRIYRQFLDLILRKENVVGQSGQFNDNYEGNFDFKQKIEPDISLTVKTLVDTGTSKHKFNSSTHSPNKYGLIYKLYGVYIKNIGNLSFSNNSSEIMTFSVNAAATSFEINPEKDSPYADDIPVEATFPGEEGYSPPPPPNDDFANIPEVPNAMSKEDRNNVVEAYKESLSTNSSEENNDAFAEIDNASPDKLLEDMGIVDDESSSKESNIPSDIHETLTATEDSDTPPGTASLMGQTMTQDRQNRGETGDDLHPGDYGTSVPSIDSTSKTPSSNVETQVSIPSMDSTTSNIETQVSVPSVDSTSKTPAQTATPIQENPSVNKTENNKIIDSFWRGYKSPSLRQEYRNLGVHTPDDAMRMGLERWNQIDRQAKENRTNEEITHEGIAIGDTGVDPSSLLDIFDE